MSRGQSPTRFTLNVPTPGPCPRPEYVPRPGSRHATRGLTGADSGCVPVPVPLAGSSVGVPVPSRSPCPSVYRCLSRCPCLSKYRCRTARRLSGDVPPVPPVSVTLPELMLAHLDCRLSRLISGAGFPNPAPVAPVSDPPWPASGSRAARRATRARFSRVRVLCRRQAIHFRCARKHAATPVPRQTEASGYWSSWLSP